MRGLAALALLGVLLAQLGLGIRSDGLTIDEVVYIGSGYRHLALADYRPNPEQPPLAKLLGAVPLLGLRPRLPELGPDIWSWSYRFVLEENDPSPIVAWARIPNVLLTLLLAGTIWAWARLAHGPQAGLVALALAVFHPSLLAHGHLLTTDLPGAITMVAGSWAFWHWYRAPGPGRAALVGLAVGVAVATRLTGWLLLPVFALLEGARWWRAPRGDFKLRLKQTGVLAAAVVVLVPLTIWAAYDFRYEPFPGQSVAQAPGPWLGRTGRLIAALESARALPEAYLEGARFVAEHNATGHPTYLLGRLSTTGWPHYYLVAFLVKNTPGFLLGVAGSAVLLWRARRSFVTGGVEAHWLLPAVVAFLAASSGRIQIGERYILPVYPYLILLMASLTPWLLAGPRRRMALGLVLGLHAVPSLLAAPGGHLSYFNFLAGGRSGGHRVLVDSNLDWGQDLPRLAAWTSRHGVDRIQLGYHGSDDPDRHGIGHEDLPGLHLHPPKPAANPFQGVVAVSPNLLLGIFNRPGENPYQELLEREPDDRAGIFFIYRLVRPPAATQRPR